MSIPLRPRFVYNDGSAVDFTFTLAQRPWDYSSRALGGSDTSAAGVPAAFQIRRDYMLHLSFRFYESEWSSVERLVRHLQNGGSATFYPDADVPGTSHTVYGELPAMGEEIRPRRSSDYPKVLELEITVRRTTSTIFTDEYF